MTGRDLLAPLRRRLSTPTGLALVYHRISRARPDFSRLAPAMDPDVFRSQLEHLRAHYRVVPASQLLEEVAQARRGDRPAVAITFDDDLPAHAETAAPLLQQAGLPAAFFLCGTSFGGEQGLWWDDLEALVESDPGRSGTTLPDDVVFDPLRRGAPGAIHTVAEGIEQLPRQRRDEVAAQLRARAGSTERALDETGIRALSGNGFEIGFHTRRHYLLPTLDDPELATALTEGRAELESLLGHRLTMIAYPRGKADTRVADAARAAAFDYGFTGLARPVGRSSDPLQLGRLDAHAVAPPDFARTVEATLARSGR
jgi:peptidoglycan/xylan/chitin deacetylase (PgdA/CDA1 family)